MKKTSPTAAIIAALGGLLAIAGSFLQWGNIEGRTATEGAPAVPLQDIAGMDSSGLWALVGGVLLLLFAVLMFIGTPKQLYWGILALVTGGVIVAAVIFSFIDIRGLKDVWKTGLEAGSNPDRISFVDAKMGIGLWLSAAAGILGVLTAPFVDRS